MESNILSVIDDDNPSEDLRESQPSAIILT